MTAVVLVHHDDYADWVFDSHHPTQGRRFTKARELLERALALPVDDGEEDGEIDVDQPFISLAGHEDAVAMLAGLAR